MHDSRSQTRIGLLYGVAAYGIWGVIPLYFKAVDRVPARELLAHRIVWSALLLLVLLTMMGKWGAFRRAIASRRTLGRLLMSTVFIACNWYMFIYSVVSGQAVQGALGYFILPLVNVAFGMLFFREKLRRLQSTALACAAIGVLVLIVWKEIFPGIALTLAFSFTFYGVIRKSTPVDAIVGLSIETLLLTPIAMGFLVWLRSDNELRFLSGTGVETTLILLSGVITTIPLICYAEAVRRLKLITIGFLQYISPSIALLIAVLRFNEPFDLGQQICFGLIWIALLLFTVDAVRHSNRM